MSGTKLKTKVYHMKMCRSGRVTWMIEELGAHDDFEIVNINFFTITPEEKAKYKAEVNPTGLIPCMKFPNGRIMNESTAMCMYLADKYQKFLPEPEFKADYYNWCFHGQGIIGHHLDTVYDPYLYKYPEEKIDKAAVENSRQKVKEWLQRLEAHLQGRTYVCGEKMTTPDFVMGYTVIFISILPSSPLTEDFPNVKAYLDKLKNRPAFITNIGKTEEFP